MTSVVSGATVAMWGKPQHDTKHPCQFCSSKYDEAIDWGVQIRGVDGTIEFRAYAHKWCIARELLMMFGNLDIQEVAE